MAVTKKKVTKKKVAKKAATPKDALVNLPEIVDVSFASSLYEEFEKIFKAKKLPVIVVDGSAVERITTPCVQILLSVALSAGEGGFKVSEVSDGMRDAFGDLGLEEQLNQWSN